MLAPSRHTPPGNFWISGALRLLLRPFWDTSRVVVAMWLTSNLGCLYMHLLSQLTSKLHEGRHWDDRFHSFSEDVYNFELLSCHFFVGDGSLGQLVNSWAAEVTIYLRATFHCSSVNHLCAHPRSSAGSLWTNRMHRFNQTLLDSGDSQWQHS